jgi:hypothetical protein
MILRRQMRRQQPHRGQGDRALLEQLEDQRVPARGSRGLDAVIGRPFGEVQHLGAVIEHRGAPFAQIQPSGIDLHQRPQQRRGGKMLFDDQVLCRIEECAVLHAREHAYVSDHGYL